MLHLSHRLQLKTGIYLLSTLVLALCALWNVNQAFADIALDPTFGTSGVVITSYGHSANLQKMALQSDGKIVDVGDSSNGSYRNWAIARYNTSGTLDTSFGVSGKVIQDFGGNASAGSIAIQSDGKIVVGGYASGPCSGGQCWTVARYNTDGTVDTAFATNGYSYVESGRQPALALGIQPDGKIVAAGSNLTSMVIRYNSDGSLDSTFGDGGKATLNVGGNLSGAHALVIQPDSKIVVMGSYNGEGPNKTYLIRYNSDGSLDSSFGSGGLTKVYMGNSGVGGDTPGERMILQSDGKLVITGTTFNGTENDTTLARFNSDGSLDSSFGSGGKVVTSFSNNSDGAFSIVLQSDNKYLVGGNQSSNWVLHRFNADGSLDSTFGSNGTFAPNVGGQGGISDLAIQTDTKLLAAGSISNGSYNDWGTIRTTPALNSVPVVSSFSGGTINEGSTYSANGSFTDPDSTSWSALVDYSDGAGAQILPLNSDKTFSLSHVYKDNGTYTVTVSVTDNQGATGTGTATVTVNNVAPTVGIVTISPNPAQINTAVTATASFTDPGVLDNHTATIDWGDQTGTHPCSVNNSSGSVSCSLSSGYTSANVYPVTIYVTDGTDSGTSPTAYASVYNPTNQGLFSAGQKYTSPVGAYTANTSLTGTVLFGLSYKYQGTMPTGVRQFSMDFNQATLHFNAITISSLVISNGTGTLTGTGTVNGSGSYNFLVTGSESANTIRIKITDPANNNNVIYDTQPGAADTATPTTSVTGQVLAH